MAQTMVRRQSQCAKNLRLAVRARVALQRPGAVTRRQTAPLRRESHDGNDGKDRDVEKELKGGAPGLAVGCRMPVTRRCPRPPGWS